ncbi:elongation of fatty acids protein 1 [Colletotrichum musicola]|uniref:Elongation of fatty acids protein n=1 Tax=Colletotrichum musicola TaxID=2175873 RepID=A0A8H6NVY7_9PEZI|nr:elongation of fatty acids protein 1 [Colletotrichum musicola]
MSFHVDNFTSNTSPLGPVKCASSSILSPWTTFDKVFTSIVGYSANGFEFVYGRKPFSTLSETSIMVVLYLIVIFGGREVMRYRKPLELNTLFKIHNLFLSLLRGALLVLFIEQLVPSLWREGLYQNICGAAGWTQPLILLYYINYLTKYYELIDTVFLMVKKEPLTFLHCYHHPATALLCFTQLIGDTPIFWVPITLNLTVHVVMYWYYFQTARGVKVRWEQWITRMQIAQFVLDLGEYWCCSSCSTSPRTRRPAAGLSRSPRRSPRRRAFCRLRRLELGLESACEFEASKANSPGSALDRAWSLAWVTLVGFAKEGRW